MDRPGRTESDLDWRASLDYDSSVATTRERVLDAARAALTTRDFGSLSLDEVRRDAGISNGSLFHHFPTKAHLARELYLGALADYQSALVRALRKAGGGAATGPSAYRGIAALVDAHIGWTRERPTDATILLDLRQSTRVVPRQKYVAPPPVRQQHIGSEQRAAHAIASSAMRPLRTTVRTGRWPNQ